MLLVEQGAFPRTGVEGSFQVWFERYSNLPVAGANLWLVARCSFYFCQLGLLKKGILLILNLGTLISGSIAVVQSFVRAKNDEFPLLRVLLMTRAFLCGIVFDKASLEVSRQGE